MGDHLAKNRTSMKKEESNLWTKTCKEMDTCIPFSHDHVKEEQYAVGAFSHDHVKEEQ